MYEIAFVLELSEQVVLDVCPDEPARTIAFSQLGRSASWPTAKSYSSRVECEDVRVLSQKLEMQLYLCEA